MMLIAIRSIAAEEEQRMDELWAPESKKNMKWRWFAISMLDIEPEEELRSFRKSYYDSVRKERGFLFGYYNHDQMVA